VTDRARVRRQVGATRASAALSAAAGLCLLVALFVPFSARGVGSAESSHALADLVLSGVLSSVAPAWVGAVWYLIGLAGAVALGTCLIAHRAATLARLVLATAAAAIALAGIGVVHVTAGPAVWLAVSGWTLTVVASALLLIFTAPQTARATPRSRP
jgi:hypothetical protein